MRAMQSADDCTYKIKGVILDKETNEPVPLATISVRDTKLGTVANEKGEFLLDKLCTKEYTLIISSVGYTAMAHHHDEHHKEPVKIYIASLSSELTGVVVEGEAITGDLQSLALDKIDKSQLRYKTNTTLASALSDIQGVTFTSVGTNVQLPVIHGLHGNRILVLNNGVKHAFQNWGDEHAPEIDIASADNISVLKGAAGVRYGPEALGGAVVVEGDPLDLEETFNGNIASGYQTNGRGYHINVGLGQGYKKFSYYLGGKYQRIGDRHAPDYSLTNTGMIESSFNAGFRYHLTDWDFKAYYSYVKQNLGLLRSSVAESGDLFVRSINAERPLVIRDFAYTINEPRQNSTHHLAKFSADWHSDQGTFKFLLSQQFNQRREFDVRRNVDLPIIDLDLNTTDTRLEWYHPGFGQLEGIIGIQYFYQNNDNNPGTQTTAFIPNYNTNRVSIFAIESLQKGNISYEFGLRLDHENTSARGRETNQNIFRNEYTFTNVTASLGLVRRFSSQWQWRSNIGSAWRTPTVAELYSFGQQGFRVQFGLWRFFTDENGRIRTDRVLTEDDGASEPEKGYKWINELTYQNDKQSLTLTAYAHLIENYIFERPIAVIGTIRGPAPVFIYDQVNAVFAGMDLTYSRTFSKTFKSKFGASYLWSQNVDDNEPLIDQPPINLSTEFTWKTPVFAGLKSSRLTFHTTYTFRQFQAPRTVTPEEIINGEVQITPDSEIFDFANAPEGYFLSNLTWEWNKGKFGGQLEVRNIFNTSYRDYLNLLRYFADEPGRNILITLNYTF